MAHRHRTAWLAALGWIASATTAAAAEPSGGERILPIGAGWARERGIDLPEPFGVGVFLITMRRDIEVTDVRVTLPASEPVSVSNVASFAVHNDTTLAALKLDAWILPVLNVYAMVGRTMTESGLDATLTVDRLLPGRPDLVLDLSQDSRLDGPMVGAGATVVAGYGRWFVLADANYNYTDLPEVEGGIRAVFASARTGWSGKTRWGGWRGWAGVAWLDTQETLTMKQETSAGTVVVEVDQRPVNPWTVEAGGSVGIGRRWEVLAELGSNFDDAFVGVFSGSFRF